ncbi:MAG: bifunctional methylenetetrahydrofolate dehydrogenase/methenyltetrahydrofolate cyclohydrolase [Alphaproteobacteria bacterium]|nr:bifunctional methylenetetrahydrofolate dehydrogenase/methenyltetrahydrofolate cyclohydrolase [Alphaproteobacteria bacterium]
MTNIINGLQTAQLLKTAISNEIKSLEHHHALRPGLAIVCIGENIASKIYVRTKRIQAKEVGINVQEYYFNQSIPEADLIEHIHSLNRDPQIHGIIVQLPLPSSLNMRRVVNCIEPSKDVDGLNVLNVGRLACGEHTIVPCTPLGCLLLLRRQCSMLSGLRVLVVGRSILVGKPMAALLLQQDCTVTIAHSKTVDLPQLCQTADIIIAAIGQPLFIKKNWIKPGAIVLDVGINRLEDGRIVGDVDFKLVSEVAGAITPVPGGVGPMTVACLLLNTILVTAQQNDVPLTYLPLSPLRDAWCPS